MTYYCQETRKKYKTTDTFKPVYRDRRHRHSRRSRRLHNRLPVRMGGLPNRSIGKALAGRSTFQRYTHSDKGGFL